MGVLDILNTFGGTSGDPRAAPNQGTGQAMSQGMSPMAKALLALLAIYAMKNMRRADSAPSQPAGRPGARHERKRWKSARISSATRRSKWSDSLLCAANAAEHKPDGLRHRHQRAGS